MGIEPIGTLSWNSLVWNIPLKQELSWNQAIGYRTTLACQSPRQRGDIALDISTD